MDKKGFTDLTESSKSSASIAQSSKLWVVTCLYQEWLAPLLISCEAAFGYEQVAKRIANIRLTQEKNMMNIGNVIKKYRKELGYTQEEMAKRLGVTTPAVNKWENGVSHS